MSTVDNRVVEMQFDDKDFTPGIKAAIDSLDKLQQALHLDTSTKGLSAISSAALTVSGEINGMQYAVTNVTSSFSALQLAAMTVLTNIVNKVTDAGIRIAKSLSIDQVQAGFGEYELKMGSIQTIMAGTGASIETVGEQLDRLNAYADKTIYSFSDMTANIGKFTNAGVELEVAVNAIQGVSNLAALSGANANEASRAMYNFAQALSAGYVKLIDWKSIENANMATVEFKKQLLETAVALGTVRKEGDMYVTTTTNAQGSISSAFNATSQFNDSLAYQWMTTDVLTTTLARYTDETTEIGKKASRAAVEVTTFSKMMDALKESIGSGWATSFEKIFGNFEEAKIMWTDLSQAIDAAISPIGDWRNAMLDVWRDADKYNGRARVIEGIANTYAYLSSVFSSFSAGFDSAFHLNDLGDILGTASVGFAEFAKGLQFTKDDADLLEYEVLGFAQALKGFVDLFSAVWKSFFGGLYDAVASKNLIGMLDPLSSAMNSLFNAMKISSEQTDDFRSAVASAFNALRDVLFGLGNVIAFVVDAISPMVKAFNKVFRISGFASVIEYIANAFYKLTSSLKLSTDQLNGIEAIFVGFFSAIKSVGEAVAFVVENVVDVLMLFADAVLDILSPIFDLMGVFLSAIGDNVTAAAKQFSTFIASVKEAFSTWKETSKLAEILRRVVKGFAVVVGGLAGGLAILVKSMKLGDAFEAFLAWIKLAKQKLEEWFNTFTQTEAVQTFLGIIGTAEQYLREFFDRAMEVGPLEALTEAVDKARAAFEKLQEEESLAGDIARGLQSAIDAVAGVISRVKAKIDEIAKLFEDLGISDGVRKMVEGVKELNPEKFSEGFAEFATGIGTLFTDYIIPAVQQGLVDLKAAVDTFFQEDLLSGIGEFFSLDKLKEKFSYLGKQFSATSLFDALGSALGGFIDGMLGALGLDTDLFDSMLANFWWFLEGLTNPIQGFLSVFAWNVSDMFGSISQTLSDAMTHLMDNLAADFVDNPEQGFQNIFNIIQELAQTGAWVNIWRILGSTDRLIETVRGLVKKIGGVIGGLGKTLRGVGRAFTGLAILEIAVGIFMIAKAFKTIADIPADRLEDATRVMAIILAAVAALIILLSALQGDVKDLAKPTDNPILNLSDILRGFAEGLKGLNSLFMGLGIAAIAGSIFLLVITIGKIAELLESHDWETIRKAAIGVGIFIAALMGIMFLISKMDNGMGVAGAGLALLGMAFAIKIIVDAIDKMITLIEDDGALVAQAAFVIGVFILALSVAIDTIGSGLQKIKGGFGTFLGIGLAFVLLAVSIGIIISALEKLIPLLDNSNATFAAFMLITFIGAIGLTIAIIASSLDKIKGGFGTFLGIGIAFLLLATALHIVVSALKSIIEIANKDGFIQGIIAISVFMVVMAASIGLVAAAAGLFEPKISTLFAIGIAFVLMSAAMWIIAKAVAELAAATPDSAFISTVIDKLGQLIIVVSLVLALAGSMGIDFAVSALAFSAAVVLMAIGVNILAGAIAEMSEIPSDRFAETMDAITKALVLFLLSAGIVAAIPPMEAALIILGGALLAAGEGVKLFGEGVKDISDALIKIQHVKPTVFDGLIEGLRRFLDAFNFADAAEAGNLADNISPLIDTVDKLSDACVKIKESNLYSSAEAIQRLLTALDNYKGSGNLAEFTAFMDAVADRAEAMSQFSDYMDISVSMVSKMGDTIPKLVEAQSSFVSVESGFIEALNDMSTGLADFRDNTTGVPAVMSDLSASMGNLVAVMAGIIEANADQISPAGGSLVNALVDGMEKNVEPAKTKFANVADRIRLAAESSDILTRFENAGKSLIATMMLGMDHKMDPMHDKGVELAASARKGAAEDSYDDFLQVGKNMGWGMEAGLSDGSVYNAVYNAAYSLASAAKTAAEAALDEHSPSRVFMTIGSYAAQGMAIGISNGETLVRRASSAMADSARMIAQDMIDDINDSKYSVYLTPIIDDSQLGNIRSNLMLGGMNLSAMQNAVAAINQNGSSNYDLLMEMRRMHDDLVAVASRPTTAVSIGEVNANDDDSMTDVTRQFVSRLAVLKGGM